MLLKSAPNAFGVNYANAAEQRNTDWLKKHVLYFVHKIDKNIYFSTDTILLILTDTVLL
jgi:hypothetical protein